MAVGYSGNTESTEKEIKEKAKARHGLELTKIPEFCKYMYTHIIGNIQVCVFFNYYYSCTC